MSRIGLSRTIKILAASAAALVAASLAAPAANAAPVKWGTIHATDGGVNVAAAYGDFANNGGVYATVGANWADMREDGNAVYVQVDFTFYERVLGLWGWHDGGSVQSTRSSRFVYVGAPLSVKLHSGATKARASIKVCEDIRPGQHDKCSAPTIQTFSY